MTRTTRVARPQHARRQLRGVTLIELIVVLAILGVMTTVTGLTMHTAAPRPAVDAAAAQVAALRDSALASGRVVTATVTQGTSVCTATVYPDGRVLTDLSHVDRLTGRPTGQSRAPEQ